MEGGEKKIMKRRSIMTIVDDQVADLTNWNKENG